MRTLIAFTALLCLLLLTTSARSQQVSWAKYLYGPSAITESRFGGHSQFSGRTAMAMDSAGNVVLTGRTNPGAGYDWLTVKYDPSGNELWRAVLGGEGSGQRLSVEVGTVSTAFDDARAVVIDTNGDVIVAGHTVADTPVFPRRCTIAKYTSAGQEIWRIRPELPSTGNWVESLCFGLTLDLNSNLIVAGQYRSSISQNAATQAFVGKYKANGDLLWTNTLSGGTYQEANRTVTDAHGNVYSIAYVDGASVSGDWVVRKLSADFGSQLWRYDRGTVDGDDFAVALALNGAGTRLAVVGHETRGINRVRQGSLVVLDADGGGELNQRYFGATTLEGEPTGFAELRTVDFIQNDAVVGGSIAVSASASDASMFAARVTQQYGISWLTTYQSANASSFARATSISSQTNRVAVVGFRTSAPTAPPDTVAIQIDAASGALIAGASYISDEVGRDEAYASVFASDGSLYVAGSTTSGFGFNYALRKFDALGTLTWTKYLAAAPTTPQLNTSFRLARQMFRTNVAGEIFVAMWSPIDASGTSSTQIVKYDTNGIELWRNSFVNTQNDTSFPRHIEVDNAGNLLLASDRDLFNVGARSTRSLVLRKFDSTGSLLWATNLPDSLSTGYAGRSITINDRNEIFVASSMFADAALFSQAIPRADWVVAKFAPSDGAHLWTFSVDGGNALDDRPTSLKAIGDAIYVAGVVNNGSETGASFRDDNWRLLKLIDGTNAPLVAWVVTTSNSGEDVVQAMSTNETSAYVVGRTAGLDGYVSKFSVGIYDNLSSASPTRTLFAAAGNDPSSLANVAYDVIANPAGGAYAVGSVGNTNAASQALLVRLDAAGNEVCRWTRNVNALGRQELLNALALNARGPIATGMLDAEDGTSSMATIQFDHRCRVLWIVFENTPHGRELGLAVRAVTTGANADRVIVAGYSREPMRPQSIVMQAIDRVSCTADFDGDGFVNATTDGAMAIRAMLGIDHPARIASSLANPLGNRSSQEAGNLAMTFSRATDFDLDGDGEILASTDGVMLLRLMLGLKGETVTADAISGNPPRSNWSAIREYINARCGTVFAE